MRYLLFSNEGYLSGEVICDAEALELNTPEGMIAYQTDDQLSNVMLVNGVITPIPQQQINDKLIAEAWQDIRIIRNSFLDNSDWTQVSDNSLTNEQRQDWAAYRQNLRNITENNTDPLTIVWPDKPT